MTFTLPSNTTTTYAEIMGWANETVNGVLGWGIILLVIIVILLSALRVGARPSKAWLAALTIATFVTAALRMAEIVGMTELTILILGLAIVYIWSYHD